MALLTRELLDKAKAVSIPAGMEVKARVAMSVRHAEDTSTGREEVQSPGLLTSFIKFATELAVLGEDCYAVAVEAADPLQGGPLVALQLLSDLAVGAALVGGQHDLGPPHLPGSWVPPEAGEDHYVTNLADAPIAERVLAF